MVNCGSFLDLVGKRKDVIPKKEPRAVEIGRFQHATFTEAQTAILVVCVLGKGIIFTYRLKNGQVSRINFPTMKEIDKSIFSVRATAVAKL